MCCFLVDGVPSYNVVSLFKVTGELSGYSVSGCQYLMGASMYVFAAITSCRRITNLIQIFNVSGLLVNLGRLGVLPDRRRHKDELAAPHKLLGCLCPSTKTPSLLLFTRICSALQQNTRNTCCLDSSRWGSTAMQLRERLERLPALA